MPTYVDATFRAMFPEYGDTTKYSATVIQVFWNLAGNFIQAPGCPNAFLQGTMIDVALYYMTAQLYTLSLRAQGSASPEANTGGVEISATIDKISVTTMPPPAADMWEYWLAQTPYGQALLALLEVASVGGLSIGGLPERRAFRKVYGTFR